MILANVVLPEPDSPTMPSVSPAPTFTLTPSSARTHPLAPIAKPLLAGKYFFRPNASIIGTAYGLPGLLTGFVAQHSARWPLPTETVGGDCSRHIGRRLGQGRGEGTPRRKPRQIGRLAADLDELLAAEARIGQAAKQRARVGVARIVEDLQGGAHLDDAPGVHHGHAVR